MQRMLRCASVLLRSSKRIGATTLGQRASMATLADVEAKLKEELGTEKLEVYDTSGGCGSSFEVSLIVSSHFEGKRALERHRLVSSLSSLPSHLASSVPSLTPLVSLPLLARDSGERRPQNGDGGDPRPEHQEDVHASGVRSEEVSESEVYCNIRSA